MGLGNFNGICAPHSQLQAGTITRGRSGLFLVGEKYLNPDNYLNGLDAGDNSSWDMGYDANVVRWSGGGQTQQHAVSPGAKTPPASPIPAISAARTSTGFGMVFCDGSVRTLNYTIDPTMFGYLGDRNLTTDAADLLDDSKW